MRRFTWPLLLALLPLLLGCSGEKDKGRNRDRDRPRNADKVSLRR